jgi:hypothetical protein
MPESSDRFQGLSPFISQKHDYMRLWKNASTRLVARKKGQELEEK